MRGTMLWFNETKDHGFIRTEEGERLYVQGSAFVNGARPEGPCAGRLVEFRATGRGDERSAAEVVLVLEVSPRRARLRRSR
jgi:cold shock CspA family protein